MAPAVVTAYRVAKITKLEDAAIEVEGADALMQRAAAGLARVAREMLINRRDSVYGARVVILVGSGNNGGDAMFAGVRLANRGAQVVAVPVLGDPHAAGAAALRAAGGRIASLAAVGLDDLGDRPPPAIDLFIDGMFGIGGRPGLTGRAELAGRATARWPIPVLAVDLPSGVDTDTGAVPGAAIQAERTVTFGHRKPCHLIEPARSRCGTIEEIDIGLDDHGVDLGPDLEAITEAELAATWPYPGAGADKYARGVVGIDTGSDQYPGAAVLSTFGVVYGGAGMVRFLGADRPAEIIGAQLPNVVFSAGRVQAHLFGSGWGERADGARVLAQALDEGLPVVVDADGLKYLPARVPDRWLLTPHAGELAALLDQQRPWVEADPLRAVRAAAEHTGATVLLKGATQLVARPGDTPVLVALPGPAWTAQAGSGDVLAGVCAALLAAGLPAPRAGQLGASIQALAARRHPGVMPPHQLAVIIGRLIGELQQEPA